MANVKITDLTSASALSGTEVLPIVQSGSTKKVTAQAIADLAAGGGGGVPNLVITTDGGSFVAGSYPQRFQYKTIYAIATGNGSQTAVPVNYVEPSYFSGGTAGTLTIAGLSAISGAFSSYQNLTSISFPDLTTAVNGGMLTFTINDNPNLTTINLPVFTTVVGSNANFGFFGNALSQANVDALLVKFAAITGTTFTLSLNGGTSAAPSATGLAAKAILVANGCTVNHN